MNSQQLQWWNAALEESMAVEVAEQFENLSVESMLDHIWMVVEESGPQYGWRESVVACEFYINGWDWLEEVPRWEAHV